MDFMMTSCFLSLKGKQECVAALQHGSFERPAVGVEQGNPQVGEGQTAHRISKVFLVFSVFHHCFMQCSCTVSVILLFIYIF